MDSAIVVALITGVFAFMGTALTVYFSGKRSDENFRTSQAVMDTKIEELTREVRLHNNFAQRLPVIEERVESIDKRVSSLEGK